MRLVTAHGVVEGDAEEVARLLKHLGAGTAEPPQAGDQCVLVVPHTVDQPGTLTRLKAPPSNEQLLHDYSADVGIGAPTRRHYVRCVEDLEYQIAPKSMLDATVDDIRAFEARALGVCALRQATSLAGRGKAASWKVRCKSGLYDWSAMQPTTCSPDCKLFVRQTDGPNGKLQAVRHFYEWLQDRGLVVSNPVAPVQRRHNRARETSDDLNRYAPTLTEQRQIVRALIETKTPRDVALVMTADKIGRRPDHTLNLYASDVHGLLDDGPMWFDFAGPRDRVKRRKKATRTKLRSNLIAPGDEELRAYYRETLMPWRQQKFGYAWDEGPLFPGLRSWREPLRLDSVSPYTLDPAMRHLRDTATSPEERARWERHLDTMSDERITMANARHRASTRWHDMGLSDLDIDILRGDRIRGAKSRYIHLTPEKVCAKQRTDLLLSDEIQAGGARQVRLSTS